MLGRHLGFDRNPLRRTVDRVEAWVAVVLMLVFLTAVPFVAWSTARAVHGATAYAATVYRKSHTHVGAVLLEDAVRRLDRSDGTWQQQATVRARWTAPDGGTRNGTLVVDVPRSAGTTVAIWIDGAGNRSVPPPSGRDAAVHGFAGGMATVIVLGCVLTLTWLGVRRHLDGRRLETWQLDWILVEPRWSGRR